MIDVNAPAGAFPFRMTPWGVFPRASVVGVRGDAQGAFERVVVGQIEARAESWVREPGALVAWPGFCPTCSVSTTASNSSSEDSGQ